MMRAIILRPLINEKSMALTQDHLYTFAVDNKAGKRLIGTTIARMFNVNVLSVKIVNIAGKRQRQRGNLTKTFQKKALKKAIVQVQKGQKIAVFEQATKPEAAVTTAEPDSVKEKKSLLKGTKVKIETSQNSKQERSKAD